MIASARIRNTVLLWLDLAGPCNDAVRTSVENAGLMMLFPITYIAWHSSGGTGMTNEFGDAIDQVGATGNRQARVTTASGSAHNIPELVSELYKDAPAPLRTKVLECLLRPVGPLAVVTIATGAFAHLLYRLRLNGVPISLDDAARITSDHVLELARFVEQCSPDALLRIGSLIPDSPVGVATVSASALLMALNSWRRRPRIRMDN